MKLIEERVQELINLKLLMKSSKNIVRFSSHFPKYEKINTDLINEINQLYVGNNIRENIFRYLTDDNEIKVCKYCKQNVKFKDITTGFQIFCSRKCTNDYNIENRNDVGFTTLGYKHTEKSLERMRGKDPPISGDNNPFKRACLRDPNVRNKASERRKEWWAKKDKKYRRMHGERASRNLRGKNLKGNRNHKSTYWYSDKLNNSIWLRSSWEISLAVFLDEHPQVVSYQYENLYQPYENFISGHINHFKNDFMVNFKSGRIGIIEVKPDALVDYAIDKIVAQQEFCILNGYSFYRVGKQVLDKDFCFQLLENMNNGEYECNTKL